MTQQQNTATDLKEHHAAVTVNAPVNQVYALFSHFNDFPKFMSFVNEVTYYDEQHSHWVADVVGRHEWDAANEGWVENRQIGWRSYNGLMNTGRATFQTVGPMMTRVDVYVAYDPPAGVLGDVGEGLGGGSTFESKLQHDLDNFARMVDQAPPGALDPTSSNYLFHGDSAAAKGTTTDSQNATMQETLTTSGRETNRPITDSDIINDPSITGINTPVNDQPLDRQDRGVSPMGNQPLDYPDRGTYGTSNQPLGTPDQGMYGTGNQPLGTPDQGGYPQSNQPLSYPDQGTYSAGNQPLGTTDQGMYNAGNQPLNYPNQGDYPTGNQPLGTPDQGTYNTGNQPLGAPDQRVYPTGNQPLGTPDQIRSNAGSHPLGKPDQGVTPADEQPLGNPDQGTYNDPLRPD